MDNPESDTERRSRKLDELKGKNVANYSVLLTAVIQSELDSIRSIIALSSAGIGVLFASAKLSEPSGTNTVLTLLGLLGFGLAVYFGINFQLAASKKYEGALFGAEDRSRLLEDMRPVLKRIVMTSRTTAAARHGHFSSDSFPPSALESWDVSLDFHDEVLRHMPVCLTGGTQPFPGRCFFDERFPG